MCTEDVEFEPLIAGVEGGGYAGRDGVRRWMAEREEAFEGTELTLTEALGTDKALFASGTVQVRGRASKLEVTYEMYGAVELRDGLVASWRFYPTAEEARRAASELDPGGEF